MLCVVMAFSSSSNCPVFFNFFTRLLTAFSHHFSSCPFSSPFFQPRSLFTIGGVNGNMDILNEHRPLIPPFHPEEQATRPLNVPASETPRQTMAGRRRGSSGLRRRIPQTELDACREWCGSPDRPTDRPAGRSVFRPLPCSTVRWSTVHLPALPPDYARHREMHSTYPRSTKRVCPVRPTISAYFWYPFHLQRLLSAATAIILCTPRSEAPHNQSVKTICLLHQVCGRALDPQHHRRLLSFWTITLKLFLRMCLCMWFHMGIHLHQRPPTKVT